MPDLTLTPRVLIINESRIVRTAFGRHLQGNYAYCEAVDGDAGWRMLLNDRSIHLVIADIAMPLLDGYNFLLQVRSSNLPHIRAMPILMVCGDDEMARERVRTLGDVGFITRDIGSAALLARIGPLIKTTTANAAATESAEKPTISAIDITPHTPPPPAQNNLLTRRYIEQQAAQALSKAMRQDSQVSVMMVGLNRLSMLRGTYGDEAVAQLQQHLAQILAETMRRQESFGHYEDDRLAIVLPDTSVPSCEAYAERLRTTLKTAKIALYGEQVLELSLSIGIANSPIDNVASAGALLELANDRLQNAWKVHEQQSIAGDGNLSIPLTRPTPTLEQALHLLRAGDEEALTPHLVELGKRLLPLFYFFADKAKLQFPMIDIERRLVELEHEQSEDDDSNELSF